MIVYILQHNITHEILGVFTDKDLAEKWAIVIGYCQLHTYEIETS